MCVTVCIICQVLYSGSCQTSQTQTTSTSLRYELLVLSCPPVGNYPALCHIHSPPHLFVLPSGKFPAVSVWCGRMQSVIQMTNNIAFKSMICDTTKLTIEHNMKQWMLFYSHTIYIVISHNPSANYFDKDKTVTAVIICQS